MEQFIKNPLSASKRFKAEVWKNGGKLKSEPKIGIVVDFSLHKIYCKSCKKIEYFKGTTFDDENKKIIDNFRNEHRGCH